MKILVTGASGFIGSHLVPELLSGGHDVKTVSRKALNGSLSWAAQVEHHNIDICNLEGLRAVMRGVQFVFHLAGLVSYRRSALPEQRAINIEGTRNVMQAALDNAVVRVVHTSSIAAMGIPPAGTIADENIDYNLQGKGLSYCDTKHEAELAAMEYYRRGLPVIILSPGIILGENDTHPHHHVIFRAISSGLLLGCPAGGVMFSDVKDVIAALLSAMNAGTLGERYVIGNANLSYLDAARCFSNVFGSAPPRFTLPAWLISGAAVASETAASLLRTKPVFTRQMAWLCRQKIFFNWAKAVRELNYFPESFENTVKRVAPYYLQAGGEKK